MKKVLNFIKNAPKYVVDRIEDGLLIGEIIGDFAVNGFFEKTRHYRSLGDDVILALQDVVEEELAKRNIT